LFIKIELSKIITWFFSFFDILFLVSTQVQIRLKHVVTYRDIKKVDISSKQSNHNILLLTSWLPRYFSGFLTRSRMYRFLYTSVLTILVLVYILLYTWYFTKTSVEYNNEVFANYSSKLFWISSNIFMYENGHYFVYKKMYTW